jgi:hypothetical protein
MIESLFTPEEWFEVWNRTYTHSPEHEAMQKKIMERLAPYADAMCRVEWDSYAEGHHKITMAMTTLSLIEAIFEKRGVV